MPIKIYNHWTPMDVSMLHSAESETAVCKGKAGNAPFGGFACYGGVDGSIIPRLLFKTDIKAWRLFCCNRGGT